MILTPKPLYEDCKNGVNFNHGDAGFKANRSGAGERASTALVSNLATARLRCAKVAMASVARFS